MIGERLQIHVGSIANVRVNAGGDLMKATAKAISGSFSRRNFAKIVWWGIDCEGVIAGIARAVS